VPRPWRKSVIWESGIHVYLKRATLNRSLFGSPAAHRRRLARRYT
jgi:hypothetical protein